jgi:hypothetical protein
MEITDGASVQEMLVLGLWSKVNELDHSVAQFGNAKGLNFESLSSIYMYRGYCFYFVDPKDEFSYALMRPWIGK